MREIHGQSTDEITRSLDISKNNLWVLIHRAKQMLKQRLGGVWFGEETTPRRQLDDGQYG